MDPGSGSRKWIPADREETQNTKSCHFVIRLITWSDRAHRRCMRLEFSSQHGLCGPPLWEVAGATLMSRLTYTSSAWWGFIDAEGRNRLNSVVANATKQGYLPPCQPSFDDICMRIDLKLFRSILSNQLLPPVRENRHNLRPRDHDRSIPDIKDSVFRKTFIIRRIYHNSY